MDVLGPAIFWFVLFGWMPLTALGWWACRIQNPGANAGRWQEPKRMNEVLPGVVEFLARLGVRCYLADPEGEELGIDARDLSAAELRGALMEHSAAIRVWQSTASAPKVSAATFSSRPMPSSADQIGT